MRRKMRMRRKRLKAKSGGPLKENVADWLTLSSGKNKRARAGK